MYTDIKVGYSCNNQCVHCVIEPIKNSLRQDQLGLDSDTSTVKQFIDEAIENGSTGIVLTGGGITIRSDFSELVNYAQERDLNVTVQTNARILRDKEKIDFLKDGQKIQFVVAVHGSEKHIHDVITRIPNSFSQTMAAIDNLLEHQNIRIVAKVVISKINIENLLDTMKMLSQKKINDVVLAFPHAEDFPLDVFESVVPRYNELAPYLEKALTFVEKKNINITLETIPYCVLNDRPEFWKYSQDIHYCGDQNLESAFIRSTGDSELKKWNVLRPNIKSKGAICSACLLEKICEGPWKEYIDYFGESELIAIDNPDAINYF